MSALEQEIWDRFFRLDHDSQVKLVNALRQATETPPISTEEWLKWTDQFNARLRAKYGDDYSVGVQSILDEIREEASWFPTSS
jgi:hypothetical protein